MIYPVPKKLCLPADRKKTKKQCVELAKKIVRSKGFCEKCGRTKQQGWQIHAAHILPVNYANTCAMTLNIIPLCASCHSVGRKSAHQNPHEFVVWFDQKYPGRYQLLNSIAQGNKKNDWSMIYIGLKLEWEMIKK
jgi:hypothetical protein